MRVEITEKPAFTPPPAVDPVPQFAPADPAPASVASTIAAIAQPAQDFHQAALNNGLARVAQGKADLILAAKTVAREIATANHTVTSTEVLATLRQRGYDVDSVDKRFMGVVFRDGFVRYGWTPTGSHKRPVTVWKRA